MGLVRVVAALAIAAAVAGCSSTPSYYSERVSGKASSYAAMSPAAADPEPAAPKRRTAKRARPAQTAARGSDAVSTAAVGGAPPAQEAESQTPPLPGAALEAQREQALKRRLNSICRGC